MARNWNALKMESNNKVSICISHFNRPLALKQAILGINKFIRPNYCNIEVLVSDDGSSKENVDDISKIDGIDKLLFNEHIGGGSNNNKLICNCSGDYIIWHQDDFECLGYDNFIEDCIILSEVENCGIIRLSGFNGKFEKTPFRIDRMPEDTKPGFRYELKEHVGIPYAEAIRESDELVKVRGDLRCLYSDHPHFKTRKFIEKIGLYKEGASIWRSEGDFVERYWNDGFKTIFWGNLIVSSNFKTTKTILSDKEQELINRNIL